MTIRWRVGRAIIIRARFFWRTSRRIRRSSASWTRSGSNNAATPQPVLGEVVDNPGGDVGSPGFVPGGVVTTLAGDYNGNGVVDIADYVLWRYAMQNGTALPHDTTPGSVTCLRITMCGGPILARRAARGA